MSNRNSVTAREGFAWGLLDTHELILENQAAAQSHGCNPKKNRPSCAMRNGQSCFDPDYLQRNTARAGAPSLSRRWMGRQTRS